MFSQNSSGKHGHTSAAAIVFGTLDLDVVPLPPFLQSILAVFPQMSVGVRLLHSVIGGVLPGVAYVVLSASGALRVGVVV
ncbi:hypothetical protein RYX36_011459 [Vicia faba]